LNDFEFIYWNPAQYKIYPMNPKKPKTKIKNKTKDIIISLPLFYRLYDFCLKLNSAIVVPKVSLSQDLYSYRSLSVTLHKKNNIEEITVYIGNGKMKIDSYIK